MDSATSALCVFSELYVKACVLLIFICVSMTSSHHLKALIFLILSNHLKYLDLALIGIHQDAFCMKWTGCSLWS